jgi:hypothetical protein
MTDLQWIQIAVALLGGGAMGAIITALITNHRNKIQPVGYRKEIIQVFRETSGLSGLQAKLKVYDGLTNYDFDNLFICRFIILNKGNADIQEFKFGITLLDGDVAIYCESKSDDRHHKVEQLINLELNNPSSELDFTLKPFNRKDIYSFNLFIVIPKDKQEPSEIKLSSQHSVKFISLPTFGEVAMDVGISALGNLVASEIWKKPQ